MFSKYLKESIDCAITLWVICAKLCTIIAILILALCASIVIVTDVCNSMGTLWGLVVSILLSTIAIFIGALIITYLNRRNRGRY
jgi:VIT1/CCC1 family predicted Fe2+/Mn2+ transporter